MRRYKTLSKTVGASAEDALYEHATELQLISSLQIIPPFPIPFIPHISDSEFTELANIRKCEKRWGRSKVFGTILGFPHISNEELNLR